MFDGVPDRRLSGEICVDDSEVEVVEGAENRDEGRFEIGVSRSAENSKPGRFPRCRERDGNDVDDLVEEWYILLTYTQVGGEMRGKKADARV